MRNKEEINYSVTVGSEAYLTEPVIFEDETKESYTAREIYRIAEKRFNIDYVPKKETTDSNAYLAATKHIKRNLAAYKIKSYSSPSSKRANITYPKERVREYLENNTKEFIKIRNSRQKELEEYGKKSRYKHLPEDYYSRLQHEKSLALGVIEKCYQDLYDKIPDGELSTELENFVGTIISAIVEHYVLEYLIEVDVEKIIKDYELLHSEDEKYRNLAATRIFQMEEYWEERNRFRKNHDVPPRKSGTNKSQ